MRKTLCSLMLAIALAAACPTAATVVVDPVPGAMMPGLGVSISLFATMPSTLSGYPKAPIQSMQPVHDGSERLFINDTRGVISVTTEVGGMATPYFDIRNQGVGFAETNSQTGLISFAFHPNFNKNPFKPGYATFFTIDTTAAGAGVATYRGNGPADHQNVVREWTVKDPSSATATIDTERDVMRFDQPFGDHGPGTIAFNPTADERSLDYGKLYIGLGDGGGVSDPYDNAQDLKSPFGKILRIDPADPDGAGPLNYSVPSDNPFAGAADKLQEVWAYGLRNPQQFSWDAAGTMYIGDIGQAQLEEVNVGTAGANYGWPIREGTFARSPDKGNLAVSDDPNPDLYVEPIAQYDHGEGYAIGAAQLYRGTGMPDLFGQLLVTDIVNGRIFYFTPGANDGADGLPLFHDLRLFLDGVETTLFAEEGLRGRVDLRLGVDKYGELYLLTKENGNIYRMVGLVPEPAAWISMIVGFFMIGATLRRRNSLVKANSPA